MELTRGEKISKALKGKIPKNIKQLAGWNRGIPHTKKHKENLKKNHWSKKEGFVPPRLGKKLSAETRRKISEIQKGRKQSKESIEKRREANKGQIPWIKGKHHTKETKEKIRMASFEYAKKVVGIICPRIGHNEKKILDKLEEELNYKIIRQYQVEGYFVDGYIKELNLCVEVDERPKNKERDIEREKIIKEKLNCEFLRINDFD